MSNVCNYEWGFCRGKAVILSGRFPHSCGNRNCAGLHVCDYPGCGAKVKA